MTTSHQNFFESFIQSCAGMPPLLTAIVHPVRATDIEVSAKAAETKLIEPVFIGPKARVDAAAAEAGIDIAKWSFIDVEHSHASAAKGAELAGKGEVGAIMKGGIHTDEVLHAIIITRALMTERRISHAYLMDIPTYHKPIVITDAAVNIIPDLEIKADILQNAINMWRAIFGSDKVPKAAILAAVETVNPKMQATLDAAALCKMVERGQLTDAVVDGPLAFDNAISKDAALAKGIKSDVAGDPDILLAPNLESCNIMSKQLTFLGNARAAGIILGAKVPVILTSRADSETTRLMSCALAVKVAHARNCGFFK